MKVLLTGATGFLGSALLAELISRGHNVIALKRSFSDCRRIIGVMDGALFYDVDLRPIDSIFNENPGIDCIVHAATCYGRNNETALEVFEANTAFPMRLLSAAAENAESGSPVCFINMSTSLPKPDYSSYAYKYITSKAHFSEWGQYLSGQGGVRFIDVVLEHMYGPFDDTTKFISYILSSCMANVPYLDLTKGGQKRDFIYIDDVVSGVMAILESLPSAPGGFVRYELGTGEALPLRQAVETIASLCGSNTELRFGALPYREGELMFSQADARLLRELNWKPEISFEQGIQKMIEAEYKENR